ncbi:MAG: SGNH/GDSL hydrolase family protein [Calditrichaeota bacterium]|nr:SGNH/GDSL hydrolase family protein [Calditrichota bacterium]
MRKLGIVFGLALLVANAVAAGDRFWLRDGDQLLFWGDSITDDGVYPRMIENFTLTYYPARRVTFVNLGWSGDRASYYPRLSRDIQLATPTRVTIMLGMNDGLYKPFDPAALAAYLDGMQHLVEILRKKSDPDIFLISPTTYDLRCRRDVALGQDNIKRRPKIVFYPATLRRFTRALQRFADFGGFRYLDLNEATSELLEDLNAVSGDFQITDDGVHPNVEGQFFMALQMLDAMSAPRDVATVAVDARTGKIDSVYGCSVSELRVTGNGLAFLRKNARLPLPIYPSTREPILRVTRYYERWNRDILRVTGLDSGWYELRIDGHRVATLRSAELEQGVNLSRFWFTPMMLQAYRVFEATERRHDAFYTKWRRVLLKGVHSPHDFTPFRTAVNTTELDQEEERAFHDQHVWNQPKEHRFELRRVSAPEFKLTRRSIPASAFLNGMVRIHVEVDARGLRDFEPPLCLKGNFSYAPQYQWAILETYHMYHDVPVKMYDDGTHGDAKPGDGIYSVDLYFRKGSGTAKFRVQDGRFLREYWNRLDRPSHRNPELDHLTEVWAKLTGSKGTEITVRTDASRNVTWDKKLWKQAVAKGLW